MKIRQQMSFLKTSLYRKPKSEVKKFMKWGPRAYFCCSAWAKRMEEAAKSLEPISSRSECEGNASLWFLTGSKFWYQTAYCAWTFSLHSGYNVELNLLDDGSLTDEQIGYLRRLFPDGQTIRKSDSYAILQDKLPSERFPMLHSRWREYINIRKLIDVHLMSNGPKLMLDSDMLFFRKPTELLLWIGSRKGICLMYDCEESYGYSRDLMKSLSGREIPKKLNVGISGILSEVIDWDELEYWCKTLIETEGMSYFLEQAIIAMIASRQSDLQVMPEAEYVTLPSKEQIRSGIGILQHYVAESKPSYFENAWRIASDCRK